MAANIQDLMGIAAGIEPNGQVYAGGGTAEEAFMGLDMAEEGDVPIDAAVPEGKDNQPGVDLEQLRSIVKHQCRQAINYSEEELAGKRQEAFRAYEGERLDGDADLDETRSRAMSRDVHDTVHAIIPSIMRIFCGSADAVEYLPVGPEDEAFAKQATEYVTQIVLKQDNDFYQVMYDASHDALVKGIGVFKWWWESKSRVEGSYYTGLTDIEFQMLAGEEGVEIDEYEERQVIVAGGMPGPGGGAGPGGPGMPMPGGGMSGPAPAAGMPPDGAMPPGPAAAPPQPQPMQPVGGEPIDPQLDMAPPPAPPTQKLIDCHVVRTTPDGGKLIIEAVPPEERLIERDARSIADSRFYGHRRVMTVGELTALGFNYEQVVRFGGSENMDTNEEAIERYDNRTATHTDAPGDPSQRELEVVECYMKVDMDGDGVAEQYRVFCGGNSYTILEWDTGDLAVDLCEDVPFAEITPDPTPHLATGGSVSHKVMDVQRIKTNLLRGSLDSLSRSIFPREEIVEGQVNLDDVMNPEIGAVIRAKGPGMVREIVTPFMGKEAMPLLQYYDEIKANRSGVSDATMGLNPQTLQSSTAGAVEHAVSAAQTQIELIARHFGRGVQCLFRGVLRTIVQNQDRARTVRLRNQWVEVDPAYWNANMDACPVTALGQGNESQKMTELGMIASKQELAMQQFGPTNAICTMAEYRNTLAEMVKLSGYYQPDKFFLPTETGQQVQQLNQQNQESQQKIGQMEQQMVAMQNELLKRSEAAETKDQAAAFKSVADGIAKVIDSVQTAAQTEVDFAAAQDEINAYNLAASGIQTGFPRPVEQQQQQPQQQPQGPQGPGGMM